MEPYHGRRGRESNVVCGMNRGKQTMLLMLAMVASMALVLVWELASPFARSGVVLTPVHGDVAEQRSDLKELELQIRDFESRPLLKSPLENTDEGTNVYDEKTTGYDQSVNHKGLKSDSSSEVGSSTAKTQSDATPAVVDGRKLKDLPEVEKQDRKRNIVEKSTKAPDSDSDSDSDEKAERSSNRDVPKITVTEDIEVPSNVDAQLFTERENETERAGGLEAVAPFESLQRSNEEVALVPESQGTASLTEDKAEILVDDKASGYDSRSKLNATRQVEDREKLTKNSLVEKLTGQSSESVEPSPSADEMIIDVDNVLQKRQTSRVLDGVAQLSDETILVKGENDSKARKKVSSAMEDDKGAELEDAGGASNSSTREVTKNLSSALEDDEEGELGNVVSAGNRTREATNDLSKSTLEDDRAGLKADAADQEKPARNSDNSEKELCDYTVGKWVLDKTRPLYSGRECSMWLSPDFACRRHNHPDKQMDRYRWQPAGCDLPTFNASAALEALRNKVVAFVGDSLGRQQLQSLLCILTRGKNTTSLTNVGSKFNFHTPRGARKPTGFAYRFDATNTTIVFKWTVTLARVQPLNNSNALHLDRPEQFLQDHLHQLDVLVLNSGHHWNNGKMKQNRYQFHNNGKPVPPSSPLSHVPVAYNQTVHNVVKWLHKHMSAPRNKQPTQVIYFRSLSPRHFRNGDWNTGGTCDSIRFEGEKLAQEGLRVDANAEGAVAGTRVRLLNVTGLSLERGESHVSKYGGGRGGQDCLHWCLPGVPDTWNEILLAELGGKFKPSSRI